MKNLEYRTDRANIGHNTTTESRTSKHSRLTKKRLFKPLKVYPIYNPMIEAYKVMDNYAYQ